MKRLAPMACGAAALAAMIAPAAAAASSVDRILIEKAARRMTLYDGAAVKARYRVALGFAPFGDKQREGDGRTPEGVYRITLKNPNSRYHLSLRLSYPDAEDRAAARAAGEPPGGDIFIHGTPGRDAPYPAGVRIPD